MCTCRRGDVEWIGFSYITDIFVLFTNDGFVSLLSKYGVFYSIWYVLSFVLYFFSGNCVIFSLCFIIIRENGD